MAIFSKFIIKSNILTKNIDLSKKIIYTSLMDIFEHFEIYTIVKFRPLGFNLDFTNISLAMLIGFIFVCILLCILPAYNKFFRKILQIYTDFIANMVESNIGHAKFLEPMISSIFLMILSANITGLLPHATTFTSYIIVNLCLSAFVILLVLILGVCLHGLKFIVKLFLPDGMPIALAPLLITIELLTFVLRIPILAGRLAINLTIGHIILSIVIMLAENFGVFVGLLYIPMFGLEIFTGCIQAYIFSLLSCIYLKDALKSGH